MFKNFVRNFFADIAARLEDGETNYHWHVLIPMVGIELAIVGVVSAMMLYMGAISVQGAVVAVPVVFAVTIISNATLSMIEHIKMMRRQRTRRLARLRAAG